MSRRARRLDENVDAERATRSGEVKAGEEATKGEAERTRAAGATKAGMLRVCGVRKHRIDGRADGERGGLDGQLCEDWV